MATFLEINGASVNDSGVYSAVVHATDRLSNDTVVDFNVSVTAGNSPTKTLRLSYPGIQNGQN